MTEPFNPLARRALVDGSLFAAVAHFVGREQTRYHLTGVLVQPHPAGNGVLLVGTDGAAMLIGHDPCGYSNGDWICPVPAPIAKACAMRHRALIHRGGTRTVLYFRGNAAQVQAGEVAIEGQDQAIDALSIDSMTLAAAYAPALDGTFPAWRKVVPHPPQSPHPNFTLNASLVTRFATAMGVLGPVPPAISLYPGESDASRILVTAPNYPQLLGVIMPMSNPWNSAVCGWLPPLPDTEPPA